MKELPTIEELRKICQPESHVSKTMGVGRGISIYLTRFILHTPMSANQITLLHGLIYLGGAAFLIVGEPLLTLAGLIVIRASGIMDLVDGEVARYRGTTSLEGEFLDNIVDQLTSFSLFIFLTFGVYHNFPEAQVIIFGTAAIIFRPLRNIIVFYRDRLAMGALLEHGLRAEKKQHNYKTHRFIEYIVKIYEPSKRLPKLLSTFLHHFHTVNLLLIVAAVDFSLSLWFPVILTKFSAMYAMLAIYGITSCFDAIAKAIYIIGTKQIQSDYEALLNTRASSRENSDSRKDV